LLIFNSVRTIIKTVQQTPDNKKQQEAERAKECFSNIETLLEKKFDRALNRVTDTNQKNDYINKKKNNRRNIINIKIKFTISIKR